MSLRELDLIAISQTAKFLLDALSARALAWLATLLTFGLCGAVIWRPSPYSLAAALGFAVVAYLLATPRPMRPRKDDEE